MPFIDIRPKRSFLDRRPFKGLLATETLKRVFIDLRPLIKKGKEDLLFIEDVKKIFCRAKTLEVINLATTIERS